MKKALYILLTVTLLLIAVFLFNLFRFDSKQLPHTDTTSLQVDAGALDRFAQSLRFKTVSNEAARDFDQESFEAFHNYLQSSFPLIHQVLKKEKVNSSLLYTWEGSDKTLNPILLMGHIDVVPVEPGTESKWTHPPFGGEIADGYVWGRGSLDDKMTVLGVMDAVEVLIKRGFKPKRTIYLAFGQDEEIGGNKGAVQIAALLKERGVRLDFVIDEGGAVVSKAIAGVSKPTALIGIAEKGFVTLELSVELQGGHSSMPPKNTAIGILSSAVTRLEKNPMPAEIEGVIAQMFRYIGPEMSFTNRLALSNLWFFSPFIKQKLSALPSTDALMRTTTAVTIFEGGVKDNVLPSRAKVVVNFRIRPGDSIASVVDHVRKVVADDRVKISQKVEIASEPSMVSNIDSAQFKSVEKSVRQIFPEAVIAPYLVIGATDSRHYRALTDNIFRFSPVKIMSEDLARIHGTDERIETENYLESIKFYQQLIFNTCQQ